MFSRDDVANFINQNFEAAWESVRPVPIVSINFGNGTVVTRTLHGNIASYICTQEGQVIDILPGVYEPTVYLDRLTRLHPIAHRIANLPESEGEKILASYHRWWAEALASLSESATAPKMDISKADIEGFAKFKLLAQLRTESEAARTDTTPRGMSGDLANWNLLKDDTRLNEIVRRRQIHAELCSRPLVRPETLVKWLYKEVLHADLDDPYLGLSKTLFDGYPFDDQANR